MQRYLVRALMQFIPTLFLASILVFAVIQLAPGDPATLLLGSDATPEQLAFERTRLGLDQPAPVRYVIWLRDVATGQFGQSISAHRPVTALILEAFPNTLKLAIAAMVLSIGVGIPLGLVSGLKKDTPLDAAVAFFNAMGLAIPGFWLGLLMILLFSVQLRWLPPSGAGEPNNTWAQNLPYLVMPVITVAISNLAIFARFMRSSLIDVLAADYIRTARAKGLPEALVIERHTLKNALVPVVTIIGIQFGRLLGGAVIAESIFSYSGLGRLAVVGIQNRDYPVVQATLMLVVLFVLLANLAVDLVYGYLDPRISLAGSK